MNSSKKSANGIYDLNQINDAIIKGQYPGSSQDTIEGDPVVEFLLKFEESNGSRIYYNSVNKRRWFVTSRLPTKQGITGDGSVVNTRSKFGSSCYSNNNVSFYRDFDGVYMRGEPIDIGDNNFTIEGWIYLTALGGTGKIFVIAIAEEGARNFETQFNQIILYFGSNGKLRINRFNDVDNISSESSSALNTNVWQHIALVKQNNTYRVFLDGVNILNFIPNISMNTSNSNYPARNLVSSYDDGRNRQRGYLKTYNTPYSNISLFTGVTGSNTFFGDEVMFTNNIAKYTSNFTPPATEFSSESTPSILFYNNFENEVLDTVGGGQKDLTERNEYILSNTTVVSNDKKFGSSSLFLNGSHQQILMDPKPIAGDFNISVWIKPSVVSECPIFFINNLSSYLRVGGGTYNTKSGFQNPNNGSVAFTIGNTTIRSSNNLVSTNTWHHIHVSRNNNTLRLFLNGSQVATGSSSSDLATANSTMVIGITPRFFANEAFSTLLDYNYPIFYRFQNLNYYSGYIDEFIIDNKPGLTSVTVPTEQLRYFLNS
jgi:hypothetical protein